MQKSFWVACNLDGSIVMFCDEPTRNTKIGKWEGNFYINSFAYEQVAPIFETINYSFDEDAQYMCLELKTT